MFTLSTVCLRCLPRLFASFAVVLVSHQCANRLTLNLFVSQDCFAEADANGDGTITFDEFKVWYSGLDASNPAAVMVPSSTKYAPTAEPEAVC